MNGSPVFAPWVAVGLKVWYYFLQKVRENMESALSIKGQATIPKAVRDHLHLGPGDRIKFFVHPDGSVVILPKLPTTSLKGMVRGRRPPATVDEMETAVSEGVVESLRRSRRR